MVDNWSASPVVLADVGEWAEWTITLSSGDAANLNSPTGPINYVALRYALSGASREGNFALIVNDVVAVQAGLYTATSSNTWASADRFRFGAITTSISGHTVVDFPTGTAAAVVNVQPWVAGTNTVRFLWFGRVDAANASEQIEVDFIAIQSGGPGYVISDWNNGADDTNDTKPVTTGSHVGYDDHVDPDPIGIGGTPPATWILDGSEATTGTVADSLLEVVKFCPPIARVRVTGDGSPIAGLAGFDQAGTTDVETLTGLGKATFAVPGGAADANFWYGGSDAWGPAYVNVDGDDRIGCVGWQVGRIGVG